MKISYKQPCEHRTVGPRMDLELTYSVFVDSVDRAHGRLTDILEGAWTFGAYLDK